MKKTTKIFCLIISVLLIFSAAACSPVDDDYGVSSVEEVTDKEAENIADENVDTTIMSLDRVMSNYFDISLFDEENYANIYLGKKFEIDATFAGDEFTVPMRMSKLEEIGWQIAEGNAYDGNSLIFTYETVDVVFINENGAKIYAQFFNSSRSSRKIKDCNIVKFKIMNDFYLNNAAYNSFSVNGITNTMAITDIVDTLGTPSHFYKVSDTSYYLDYFVTKKDRRNGITVYINPVDDLITAIEFSCYK
ncbi:MAG: hypothetical protein E7560_01165 [Ruminococcaceae bacterium]|nr:hypothetical protein [Oscillospiraceae bacterium]